jgi:adenosine deaminase CECR1
VKQADGMGVLCSTVDKDGDDPPVEGKAQAQFHPPTSRRLRKMPQSGRPGTRSQQNWRAAISNRDFESPAAYNKALEELQDAEKAIAFDAEVTASSSNIEKQAAALVRKIKAWDWDHTYGPLLDPHTGSRKEGEHFLGNVDLINKTELMKVAKRMPKGAHLHIHFNACLPARFLIQQARDIDAMYIRSTLPLTTPENMEACRISFMVMTLHEATHTKGTDGSEIFVPLGNVWDHKYVSNRWMSYKQFQRQFEFTDKEGQVLRKTAGAETWLERKMIISEEEAHNSHQTGRGYVTWLILSSIQFS